MNKSISIEDVELKICFDNLEITIEQMNYGIFNHSISRHRHGHNYYEAHFICGGKGTLIVDGNEYDLERGTVCMTGPDIVHEQVTDENDHMEEYCFGFYVKRKKKSVDTVFSSILVNTHFWIGNDSGTAENLFEMIASEAQRRLIGFENNIKNIASCILVHLVRLYTDNTVNADRSRCSPDTKRTLVTDTIFLYEYATITRKKLADMLYLSERQLQRFLMKEYGKSFSQLKKEARINKAKELLRQGKTVEEAAVIVGYSDIRSFKRLIEDRCDKNEF